MKKGGGHIFQLSLICTLKAIEVIKKVKKRKKDWVIELRQINTLCSGRRMTEENKTKPPDFSTKVFDKVLLISAFHGPLAE